MGCPPLDFGWREAGVNPKGALTRARVLILCGLAALAFHGIGLGNGFAYDDEPIISDNPVVTQGDWRAAAAGPYWQIEADYGVLWRPVALVAFTAEWQLFGGSPFGFHAVNVVLNALVSILVALLILSLLGSGAGGLAAALGGGLLFAAHPVHVEAVGNVVGQGELLAAALALSVLLIALAEARSAAWRALQIVGVAVGFGLALGSKEIAVTLPAVLVLVRMARDDRGPVEAFRVDLPLHLVMAAVGLTWLVLRAWVLGSVVGEDLAPPFMGTDALGRIWTALSVAPMAWMLLLAPINLSADYDPGHLLVTTFPEMGGWVGAMVVAALLTIGTTAWRRGGALRWCGLGVFWVMLVRLPVSNLIIPTGVILAERTLFLPSVGIALALAGLIAHGIQVGWAGRRMALGVAAVVLLFGVGSAVRTPVWFSTFTAMASLGEDAPESWRAQRTLAAGLRRSGEHELGMQVLQRAAEVMPWRFDLVSEIGAALKEDRRLDEARPWLESLVEHWPHRPAGYNLLAELHLLSGDYREAHRVTTAGIAATGGDAETWGLMSEAYIGAGLLDAAVKARSVAVQKDPSDVRSASRLSELQAVIRERDAGVAGGAGDSGDAGDAA